MTNRIASTIGALALVAAFTACADSPAGPATDAATLSASRGSDDGSVGTTSGSVDTRQEANLVATSAAFPRAKGRARFRDRGGERELQIEVENLRPGIQVGFFLDGSALICSGGVACTATVNQFGKARINLNTDGGPGVDGTAVPASVSGSTVSVATGGTTVAAGTFN